MRKFETVDEVKSVTAHEVINTTFRFISMRSTRAVPSTWSTRLPIKPEDGAGKEKTQWHR